LSLVTMSIYHDYHGDSKDSSILTCDQIQISLKYLLLSYQPILCDSLVSSFLSNKKQQQICAHFKPNFTSDGGDELRSLAPEIGGTTQGDGDEGFAVSSSAEDGAFPKGNVDAYLELAKTEEELKINGVGRVFSDSAAEKIPRTLAITEDVDLSYGGSAVHVFDVAGSSAEVGASTREKWSFGTVDDDTIKMRGGGCAGVAYGSLAWRKGKGSSRCRLLLTARPASLLAAVFPWDRERKSNTEKMPEGGTVEDADLSTGSVVDGGAGGMVFFDVQVLDGHNCFNGVFLRQYILEDCGKGGLLTLC
ncbi:hypothetical protein PIB30_074545, partial [Stylosanthes scabra]|nr:hypothetical protein [Stylosanthes scabra]